VEAIPVEEGVGKKFVISTNEKGVGTFSVNFHHVSSDEFTYMAVVDHDGAVQIKALHASISDGYSAVDALKTISSVVERETIRSKACKISWSPASLLLAVPGKQVVTFAQSEDGVSWKDIMLSSGDSSTVFQLVSFSPNGAYLAAADTEGIVTIYEVNESLLSDCKEVCKYKASESLVDLAWGSKPGDNYLMLLSSTSYAQVMDVVPNNYSPPTGAKVVMKVIDEPKIATPVKPSAAADDAANSPVAETAATTTEETITTTTETAAPTATTTAAAADKMDVVIEPEANNIHRRLQKSGGNNDDDDDDDIFGGDDDAATNVTAIKQDLQGVIKALDKEQDDDAEDEEDEGQEANFPRIEELEEAIRKAKEHFVPIQSPFQPSETRPDDKARRYLVWNSIGNITSRAENDANRIEIRFSNTMSRNKQEAFPDQYGFTMASLAYEGAIFASPPEVLDAETSYRTPKGSVIHYHAFPSFLDGANETFTTSLPEGEAALAVAVGSGWSAVATSKGFLRIFSSTGYQLSVSWLKGPIVCMCGYGAQLAVITNSSQPLDGTARLIVELYCINPFAPGCSRSILPSEMAVPLSAKSTLSWIGFDVDSKFLTIIDSAGMCSMLMRPFGWQWIPVLDIARAKKATDHVYWPIMTKASKLVYVLLNGESRPAVYPQPVTAVKQLRIPVIELKGETKELKEKAENFAEQMHLFALQNAIACHWDSFKTEDTVFGNLPFDGVNLDKVEERLQAQEKEADKSVLWLLQQACAQPSSAGTARALDLAHKLRTAQGIEAGILVANKFGRLPVAKKLQEIQDSRNPPEPEPEQEPESYEYVGHGAATSDATYSASDAYDEEFVGGQDENVTDNKTSDTSAFRSFKSKQVTPSVGASEPRVAAFNPFQKGASPGGVKRKTGYEVQDLKSLKGSPSPKKKPMLAVSLLRSRRQVMSFSHSPPSLSLSLPSLTHHSVNLLLPTERGRSVSSKSPSCN